MAYDFKKLADVEQVQQLGDEAMVLAVEDGVVKKVSKGAVAGVQTMAWDDIEGRPEIPVHTWESLPDKPFGKDVNEIVVCDVTDITPNAYDNDSDSQSARINKSDAISLAEGMNCHIVIDGSYEIDCVVNSSNKIRFDYEDDSYTIENLSDKLLITVISANFNITSLKITTTEETITKLSPEFLPEHEHEVGEHTHSWNDLEDRPFGESKEIIWQGNWEELQNSEIHTFEDRECARISLPTGMTIEDLNYCKYVMYENGTLSDTMTIDLNKFVFQTDYTRLNNSMF